MEMPKLRYATVDRCKCYLFTRPNRADMQLSIGKELRPLFGSA
jgi:hypothetical protein